MPRRVEDAAQSLGAGRTRRLATVQLPLMRPGLLAGAGLVLLSTMKELPATLILAPPDTETLATADLAQHRDGFFAQAGLAALVLLALSGVLTYCSRSDRGSATRREHDCAPVARSHGVTLAARRRRCRLLGRARHRRARIRGGRVTADEPQYLMTAISLGEDLNLDISDERARRPLPRLPRGGPAVQEQRGADGRAVSPHDPLLPAYLALPVLIGGWVGAKLALAVLAGAARRAAWCGSRSCASRVPRRASRWSRCSRSRPAAPLAMYGTQVYPELPAAFVVAIAIAALTGRLKPERSAVLTARDASSRCRGCR